MGGFHVVFRETKENNYDEVSAYLRLPKWVNAEYKLDTIKTYDKNTNTTVHKNEKICPEFFLGFYQEKYGLDVGVLFDPYDHKYRMFLFAMGQTADNSEKKDVVKYKDETEEDFQKRLKETGIWRQKDFIFQPKKSRLLKISAYIDHKNKIFRSVIYYINQNKEHFEQKFLSHIEFKLSDVCAKAFKQGCKINREISISSNLKDNLYAPSNVLFSEVIFEKTDLSRNYKGEKNIKMNRNNSRLVCRSGNKTDEQIAKDTENQNCVYYHVGGHNSYSGYDDFAYYDRILPTKERRKIPEPVIYNNTVNLIEDGYVVDKAEARCFYGE